MNTSLNIIGKEAYVILWKSVSNFNSASKRVQYLQAKLLPQFKLAYEFDWKVQSKLLPEYHIRTISALQLFLK